MLTTFHYYLMSTKVFPLPIQQSLSSHIIQTRLRRAVARPNVSSRSQTYVQHNSRLVAAGFLAGFLACFLAGLPARFLPCLPVAFLISLPAGFLAGLTISTAGRC